MMLFDRTFATVLMLAIFGLSLAAQAEEKAEAEPVVAEVLEVTADTKLDPAKVYGAIVIKTSGITLDGNGAWLVGPSKGSPKEYRGTAIFADGVSDVKIFNLQAKQWETGLHIKNGSGWTVENCNFSGNFHDPDFGWGENGRRGGILLEHVQLSSFAKNRANHVWDACSLVNSDGNTFVGNDFSHTSNTCLKLWTSCKNKFGGNNFSYGIRIAPGEVHARDSTSVLIESGSNGNHFSNNDCTYGGDGIFIRVLNGWCSTDNLFDGNDCSYANNNGIECWAPRNTFWRNKANHCSYGFWLGGSDQTRLVDNEACFNGLAGGFHNSPHLPGNRHAGIVFMFGPSSHTVAIGNRCHGNNGAGIAIIGDQPSQGKKWKAYHWILERNQLTENSWGIYAQYADWIVSANNHIQENKLKDVELAEGVTRFQDSSGDPGANRSSFSLAIQGPQTVKVGEAATWTAKLPKGKSEKMPAFQWDFGKGEFHSQESFTHTFDAAGFQRIGLNVMVNGHTELAWRDVYVVKEVDELGTESSADEWSLEDFQDRKRSDQQVSRATFHDDNGVFLVGNSSLAVSISPYAGFRAALTYPSKQDAAWPSAGKTKVAFWLKAINADTTGWQGGPFLVLHGEGGKRCYVEPASGKDFMRELEYNEAREGWRRLEIPLQSDERWKVDGEVPKTITAISLAFDSWGAPPLKLWIDGLSME